MNVFGLSNVLVLVISLGLLLLMAFATVDSLLRPTPAYPAAGKQTKLLWSLVLGVTFALAFATSPLSFLGLPGVVAALVYIVDVRPAVRSIGRGGSASGPYGPW